VDPALRRLLTLLGPHRGSLGLAVLASLVLAAATSAYAFLLGPLLKVLLTGAPASSGLPLLSRISAERVLVVLPAALVAAAAVRALAQAAQSYLTAAAGQRVVAGVRRDLYARYLALPQSLLGEKASGDLLARFSADVQGVEQALAVAVATLVRDVLQVLALLAVCAFLDLRLLLAAVAVVPLAAWPLTLYTRALKRVLGRSQDGLGRFTGRVGEAVANVRVVQAFAREEAEVSRFDGEQQAYLRVQRTSFLLRAAYSAGGRAPGRLRGRGGHGLAAGAIARGTLSGEALLSFLTALALLYQPLKSLAAAGQHLLQGLAGARRVFEVLDAPARMEEPLPDQARPATFEREVALRGVDFSYDGESKVLSGIELTLPGQGRRRRRRERLGQEHPRGAAAAVLGPQRRRVEIDGRDARTLRLADLRRLFAYVPQDPVLFAGTVRDHLACVAPGAGDDRLSEALRPPTPGSSCRGCPAASTPRSASGAPGCRAGAPAAVPGPGPAQRRPHHPAGRGHQLLTAPARPWCSAGSRRCWPPLRPHVLVIAHRLTTVQEAERHRRPPGWKARGAGDARLPARRGRRLRGALGAQAGGPAGPEPPAHGAARLADPRARPQRSSRGNRTGQVGCEPVVESAARRQLVWLMAEFFKTIGYTDLKARLPGYVPPVVLSGTLEDHRPDLTCRQSNSARTPTLVEAVPVEEIDDPKMEHRWTLLSSAAKLYGAELHFVCPSGARRAPATSCCAAAWSAWTSPITGSGWSDAPPAGPSVHQKTDLSAGPPGRPGAGVAKPPPLCN
jgi:subfamily B ATP-binding cassette protein MsbA